jgi:phage terminase small subunit
VLSSNHKVIWERRAYISYMGARGPAPVPSAVKRARGTYRADRAPRREAEPELVSTVPPAPKWLTLKAERQVWADTAAVLIAAGLLTLADHDTLAAYCRAKVNYINPPVPLFAPLSFI